MLEYMSVFTLLAVITLACCMVSDVCKVDYNCATRMVLPALETFLQALVS